MFRPFWGSYIPYFSAYLLGEFPTSRRLEGRDEKIAVGILVPSDTPGPFESCRSRRGLSFSITVFSQLVVEDVFC